LKEIQAQAQKAQKQVVDELIAAVATAERKLHVNVRKAAA